MKTQSYKYTKPTNTQNQKYTNLQKHENIKAQTYKNTNINNINQQEHKPTKT